MHASEWVREGRLEWVGLSGSVRVRVLVIGVSWSRTLVPAAGSLVPTCSRLLVRSRSLARRRDKRVFTR